MYNISRNKLVVSNSCIYKCMYTQGINQSANLSFVQRLSVIFGYRRDSAISSFLPRRLCLVNSFPLTLSVGFSFLSRVSAGNRITWTVSAGSHFSWRVVSAGSRRSWTVSAEAKSLQEAKIGGFIYTLWYTVCCFARKSQIFIFM